MVEIIQGAFDLELAKHYARIIDKAHNGEIALTSHHGGEGILLITGSHTLKHPHISSNHRYDYAKERRGLVNTFQIGRGLRQINLNVPHMHAVCLDYNFPFLIMERLNLTPLYELKKRQRKIAEEQYFSQIKRAQEAGFVPHDSCLDEKYGIFNYEFDVTKNKGYLFDFSTWRKAG